MTERMLSLCIYDEASLIKQNNKARDWWVKVSQMYVESFESTSHASQYNHRFIQEKNVNFDIINHLMSVVKSLSIITVIENVVVQY